MHIVLIGNEFTQESSNVVTRYRDGDNRADYYNFVFQRPFTHLQPFEKKNQTN